MTKKKAEPLMQISRKALVVCIGLLFFVAAWMFFLGVLVGRGTAPVSLQIEKWKTELSDRKARMLKESEVDTDAQGMDQIGSNTDLGFYEALKDGSSGKNYHVQMPPTPPVPVAVAPKAAEVAADSSKPWETPAAAAKPPGQTKVAKEPVRDEPAEHVAGQYTVQVAAFKELEGARQMVDELRSKGYPAYQVKSLSANKAAWFRVRVGAFKQRAEAEKLLKKLNSQKIKGLIVSSK